MRRFCGFYFFPPSLPLFFFLHFVIPFFQLHLVAVDIPATSPSSLVHPFSLSLPLRLASLEQNPSSVVVPYRMRLYPHCKSPQFPASPSRFPEPPAHRCRRCFSLSRSLLARFSLALSLFRSWSDPRRRRSCFCFELTLGGFRVREFMRTYK